MTDIIRLLLVPVYLAAGASVYRRNRTTGARIGGTIMAGTTLAVILLGLMVAIPALRHYVHGYLGHLVIATGWVALLFAAGISASRGIVRRSWTVVVDIPLILGSLGGLFLCGFTGYLYPKAPSKEEIVASTAMLRFLVMHATLLPALTTLLALIAYLRFRHFKKESIQSLP